MNEIERACIAKGLRMTGQRRTMLTVMMATHDLYRAKAIGDRVAILSAGRLMTVVRTADIEYPELESLYLQMASGAAPQLQVR